MLQSLSIQNYAIIDDLTLSLDTGMTIITGETGAGKSILLGALSLILGRRADTDVLYQPDRKCIVEGRFAIEAYALEPFFHQHNLDYEPVTFIRREINKQGKSRAFVNDTPVTLTVLRQLTSHLVDLHQQHETADLATDRFQLDALDALARQKPQVQAYTKEYRAFKKMEKELDTLREEAQRAQQEADYWQFQYDELAALALKEPDEQEKIEQELAGLTHAEQIKEGLWHAIQTLDGTETSIIDQINHLSQQLETLARYQPVLHQAAKRLESAGIELQDLQREMEEIAESTQVDESLTQELQERLNAIYRLQKKHGVTTLRALMDLQQDLESRLNGITDRSARIEKLTRMLAQQRKMVLEQAKAISKHREKAGQMLAEKVNALLKEVGMPNGRLHITITQDHTQLLAHGIDEVTFAFSANKGAPPQPIRKVASGGELSRLMLVIKSLIASSTALPTLIFDEIDTGISGEVALRVGQILEKLAAHHQVAVITHLPQIAGKGNTHYFVYKKEQDGRTVTRLRLLEDNTRVQAIAEMIGGDKPSQAALDNAKELLRNP